MLKMSSQFDVNFQLAQNNQDKPYRLVGRTVNVLPGHILRGHEAANVRSYTTVL